MSHELLDRKLTVAFGQMDLDGDGYIEKADVIALGMNTVAHFGIDPTSAQGQAVNRAFEGIWTALAEHFDTDGDGRISPDEYRAGFVASFGDQTGYDSFFQPAVDAIISLGGSEQPDTLNLSEWRTIQAAYGTSQQEADEVFRLLDTDGSGLITRAELGVAA
ncbi:EF-hand domain-containing protein, partial [Actinosynnema sp. NPDC023658]|uniref:EF-hand domain-containing protein n=1 Tax=Actinosynnema sp. NPDC023658 TaxID=3155465 RepID=UPI0033CBAEF5